MPVHTEVTFQKMRYVSDSEPHMRVQEKIRFHVVGAVHTAIKQLDLGDMGGKNI